MKPWEEFKQNSPAPWEEYQAQTHEAQAQPQSQPKQEAPSVTGDIVKSFAIGIPKGAASLAGLPGTIGDFFVAQQKKQEEESKKLGFHPRAMDYVQKGVNAVFDMMPSYGDIKSGAEKVTGEWYQPKTTPGRIAEFTGELLPSMGKSAITPRGLLQTFFMGTSGGAAKEVADKISGGNPWITTPAAMIGTVAGGLPFMLRGTNAQTINTALQNVTPQQLDKAKSLMADAAQRGSPITGAEAIAQITGKNTLQDVQRVVEASPKGGPIMQPMMNARPLNNQVMFENAADVISPFPAKPAQVPVRMAKTAQDVIENARNIRTQNVTPEYASLVKTDVPKQIIYAQRAINTALKSVDEGSPSAAILRSMSERIALAKNAAQLDNIYKEMRDKLGALPIDKNALTSTEKGVITPVNAKLGSILEDTIPAVAQGRAKYQQLTNDLVNPIKESPIGDLAKTVSAENANAQMGMQANILMPQGKIWAIDPKTIKGTIKGLQTQDPTIAAEWTRQALQAHFDDVTQNLVGGANQWGGAKFAAQIAGNPTQEANLRALIEASTKSKSVYPGFKKMLSVLEAQGKRHATGSQTEFNRQISSNLGQGSFDLATKPTRAIGEWYQNFRYGKNADQMAKLLTDPNSIDKMKQLAMMNPSSAKAQLLVAEIIASQSSENEASGQSNP